MPHWLIDRRVIVGTKMGGCGVDMMDTDDRLLHKLEWQLRWQMRDQLKADPLSEDELWWQMRDQLLNELWRLQEQLAAEL